MNIKKVIIILIIAIIVVSGILIFILVNNKDINKPDTFVETPYSIKEGGSYRYNVEEVDSKYDYFDTITCIQKYLNVLEKMDKKYYNTETSEQIQETMKIYREELYSYLDEDYINQNNLTISNIDNYLSDYYGRYKFIVDKMYGINISNTFDIYFVYGKLVNDNGNVQDYGFIVKRRTYNLIFSIMPYDYMIKNNYTEENITKIQIKESTKVELKDNNYNAYSSDAYDNEYVVNYYFSQYKDRIQYDIEAIYNLLDDNYKNKRFSTLQKYNNYVSEYKQDLLKSYITQYSVKEYSNTKQYNAIDQYGNSYIFIETMIGNYNIMLDSYTIKTQEILERYESASQVDKVGINISIFFDMLNTKDYDSAYNVLTQEFKNNYFPTLQSFRTFVSTYLYKYNKIKSNNYSNALSGVYTYNIEIINAENESNTKRMNIVMQLLEGTDFVMSFSIE